MKFEDKYCAASDKDKPENGGKKIISDEAYAMCEVNDTLRKALEALRQAVR